MVHYVHYVVTNTTVLFCPVCMGSVLFNSEPSLHSAIGAIIASSVGHSSRFHYNLTLQLTWCFHWIVIVDLKHYKVCITRSSYWKCHIIREHKVLSIKKERVLQLVLIPPEI